jgi:hypothetical protein
VIIFGGTYVTGERKIKIKMQGVFLDVVFVVEIK